MKTDDSEIQAHVCRRKIYHSYFTYFYFRYFSIGKKIDLIIWYWKALTQYFYFIKFSIGKKIDLILLYWKALTQGSEETVCGKIKNYSN